MAKVEIDVDDMHENSLDNSADSEYLGIGDEGSFGSAEQRSHLVPQSFLDSNENSTSYNFKDISGSVTYKLISMTGEETITGNPSPSPPHNTEFYVITNPVEVFGTTAAPKKAIRRDPMQAKAVNAKKRDDKRRATHNEVERRRRDKINSWITKLAAMVPNSGLPDSASKGGILAKACDHIADLTSRQKRLEKLEEENEKLVLEVLRLNQELAEVRKENTSMRNQLADNCIVINHRPKDQKS
ncbi:upstream stimulatory factor 2 [Manduca sexta]|uniref:BHLH domain-containing protein n=1 Tax=Manduca sexta TaxID=7130 RepID=A0A922CCD4_MANSE|nr:upstream stimulatory factor 2 [Manduca sexta]KAG6440916.1 hypothetical protein O3G_MSEX001549 [Manduca sexta]